MTLLRSGLFLLLFVGMQAFSVQHSFEHVLTSEHAQECELPCQFASAEDPSLDVHENPIPTYPKHQTVCDSRFDLRSHYVAAKDIRGPPKVHV